MPPRVLVRSLGVVLTLLVSLGVAGCVFPGGDSPRQRISEAAQDTLDELGLRAGVEMFNDAEGFAASYSILLCAEAPDDLDATATAELVARIVNALRPMTDDEADYVNAVQVRLVPESVHTTTEDLQKWCRPQWTDGLVDLTDTAELFSTGEVRGTDFEVSVPFDEVELVETPVG